MDEANTTMDETTTPFNTDNDTTYAKAKGETVWFLVEKAQMLGIYLEYAERLEKQGFRVRVVNAPEVFGQLTKAAIVSHAERFVHSIKVAIGLTKEEFQAAVENETPDVLFVCGDTFFRPLAILGQMGPSQMAIVAILDSPEPTDTHLQRYRLSGDIQGWIVPMEVTRQRFLEQGVEGRRVVVGGMAMHEVGVSESRRAELREQFQFGEGSFVLVRPGALSQVTELEGLMFQLSLVSDDVRLVFHHDGNRHLAEQVRRLAERKGMFAQMFGHVENLGDYLRGFDLVLTTPFDDVSVMTVGARTPLLLMGGRSVLVDAGVAVSVEESRGLPKRLLQEVRQGRTPELLGLQELALPVDTAQRLYQAIVEVIAKTAAWKEDDAAPQTTPGDFAGFHRTSTDSEMTSGSKELVPRHGESPFQTIGRGYSSTHDSNDDPLAAMRRKFASAEDEVTVEYPRGTENGATLPPSPTLDPEDRLYRNLNKSAAKAVMTELILEERTVRRELEEGESSQEIWYRRLNLARSQGAEDLEESARKQLQRLTSQCDDLRRRLALIEKRKRLVKGSVGGGADVGLSGEESAARLRQMNIEDRFRKLEEDARLEDLKRSMEE